MNMNDLLFSISLGEDSTRQFKSDVRNVDALAIEMAAFANSEGGTIFIGVADDGSTPGLSFTDVKRINQYISNAASQHIHSPLTVQSENVPVSPERVVISVTVPKGIDKPYFDRNGTIWLKCGPDKRRLNSKEELRRFFQFSDQFHADELPTNAGIDKLDKLRFRDFLRDAYKLEYPDNPDDLARLLRNMNLATDDDTLNLAGVLLFAERPEWIKPQFIIKAIRYPGNDIHATSYLDTEDFSGPFQKIFADALAFIMRNLHKVQAGQGVNAPGTPEIPASVFEELLVNALIHRDYLVDATIRLFIFDNRIEIISPGHLPNNLTVERIRAGISNIRNPILVSFVAKGILPYRGLGSGIKRALEDWPMIDFTDEREACLFTATVYRNYNERVAETPRMTYDFPQSSRKTSEKVSSKQKTTQKKQIIPESTQIGTQETLVIPISTQKSTQKIIELIRKDPTITRIKLAQNVGITDAAIKKQLGKMKTKGLITRIGPDKGGYWEVIERSEG